MQSWAKALRRIYFVRHTYNGGGQKKKYILDCKRYKQKNRSGFTESLECSIYVYKREKVPKSDLISDP